MAKIILFIDGTWLYCSVPKLTESYGEEFHIDYGKLPQVLAEEVGSQVGLAEVDVVRTYLFGSYASNHDLRDDDVVQRRLEFFSILKEDYHYEVEIFPINFRGRRLRREDRNPQDTYEPKEKCVDICLATLMLYFAAIPYAYDIAIAVVGDQDFRPVLQHVRRLGKRVAIASIKNSCAPEFADPRDEARVKDFDIIWLDDLLQKIEFKYERQQLECQSPLHKGNRKVWTTFRPRKGQKFYCEDCREEFMKQKHEAQKEYISSEAEGPLDNQSYGLEQTLSGDIIKIIHDRGFGFIKISDGKEYFFHLTDIQPGLEFEEIKEGLQVDFEVKKEPSHNKAGAAQNVRLHTT